MKIDKSLDEVFDLEPYVEGDIIKKDGTLLGCENDTEEFDFQRVRDNMLLLLTQGGEGLEFAIKLAKDTENPKAIDAFTNLLNSLVKTNAELMNLHATRKEINVKNDKPSENNTVNNNVFVGSASELKTFINKMKLESDK